MTILYSLVQSAKMTLFKQQRRTSPRLTYRQHATLISGRKGHPRNAEKAFLYRSLFAGTVFLVACLYVSVNNGLTPLKRRKLAKQLNYMSDHMRRRRLSKEDPATIQYTPEQPRERTQWTLDDFSVNGVNLAQFGFEKGTAEVQLDGYFELYEDFSLAHHLQAGEKFDTVYNLLMLRRFLDSSSLAFYIDKIAQKEYLRNIGIPVPEDYIVKYQKQFNTHASDQEAIRHILPKHADYVATPSHRKGKHFYVSYDEDTNVQTMGPEAEKMNDVYNPDQMAQTLAKEMANTRLRLLDARALAYVPSGIVVEDRLTAFDSLLHAPAHISVYCVWGKAFIGFWQNCEKKHPGIVFGNGTLVMDDGERTKMPRWTQWDDIVEIAEDLAMHKDFYQIDFEIGVNAGTSRLLEKATRQQRMEEIQVVVTDVVFNPTIFKLPGALVNEMGRLWTAGYRMGFYRTIHNDESSQYIV